VAPLAESVATMTRAVMAVPAAPDLAPGLVTLTVWVLTTVQVKLAEPE